MKLKNILFFLFIFVFMCGRIWAQNTNPVVSNVAFSITGTTVTVTYDVSDAEQSEVTIIMRVSVSGGTTWDWNYGATGGDIGAGISTGTGKTITWTYNGGFEENFKMKIYANDEIAGGSPCLGTAKVYYEGGPNNDEGGDYYSTIQIGDQCWLKENLDIGTKINSNSSSDNQTDNSIIEKYCYNNDENNCDTYGGLYQWDEAMQYSTTPGVQGICPPGWHIPTWAEFLILRDAAGGSTGSNALKAIGVDANSTNTSGFSALFEGYRSNVMGVFDDLGIAAYFWSSTEHNPSNNARTLFLNSTDDDVHIGSFNRGDGRCVRCIKD